MACAGKYGYYTGGIRHMAFKQAVEYKVDDRVTFTNSAGRTITGTVTIVERTISGGTWITVFETPGSVYKLPADAVKRA